MNERATRAQVAQWVREHGDELEMVAEMTADERAEYVWQRMHPRERMTDESAGGWEE
jgi:hypothetical protein